LQVAKDEGLAGLFAGTTPRIAKAILSGAIQFATYEETKRQFLNWISQL
jgi:solute carrier family 25 (mitochondrial S-adenosylmethionine transporter), member 26